MSREPDEFTTSTEQAAMIESFTVQHCERLSQRSFEGVVAAFEAAFVGIEDPPFLPRARRRLACLRDNDYLKVSVAVPPTLL
jgi:hypothetical protein